MIACAFVMGFASCIVVMRGLLWLAEWGRDEDHRAKVEHNRRTFDDWT